ncbi:hypothetical protein KM043_004778 [Ampulex compressa]|nr:hypothetical protein KM043_004778 [Ampulex compressa]
MSICSGFFRVIRRRLVLGIIFALSVTYCTFSLLRHERKLQIEEEPEESAMMKDDDLIGEEDSQLRATEKMPLWQVGVEDRGDDDGINLETNANFTDTINRPCRNSVQGKVLIVDERGVVCARREVLPDGCCGPDQKHLAKNENDVRSMKLERYSCKTCNVQGCCSIYEYCVSCCLHPGKQVKSRKDTASRAEQRSHRDEDPVKIRLRSLDRFQVCLAACRTSSASVRHENTYKDPHLKHCYILQPRSNRRRRRGVDLTNNNADNPQIVLTFSPVIYLLQPLSPIFFYSFV